MSKQKKQDQPKKEGRLSREENTYILANAGKLTVDEIAKKLGRRKEAIENVIRKRAVLKESGEKPAQPSNREVDLTKSIRSELRSNEAYKRLSLEFTREEIKFFEDQYTRLMLQFRANDVLPSEEMQVFDCVKLEILKSRNLIERQKNKQELARLEKTRADILARNTDLDELELKNLAAINREISACISRDEKKTLDYTTYLARQESIMKSLKSTRDQRIEQLESGKTTFVGLIKQLQNLDFQKKQSRVAELNRLAAEAELRRLAKPHQYEDGSWDLPILSADTVGQLENLKKDEE